MAHALVARTEITTYLLFTKEVTPFGGPLPVEAMSFIHVVTEHWNLILLKYI